VRESHARGAAVARGCGDALRRGGVHQPVHLAALGDVPVLAELAGKVATCSPERQHAGAGEEMVERLLLYGIEAEAGAAAVRGEHHPVAGALAHEAHAALPVVQPAVARAQIALDAAVVQTVPPSPRLHRGRPPAPNVDLPQRKINCVPTSTGPPAPPCRPEWLSSFPVVLGV